jgi:hypothetical protein
MKATEWFRRLGDVPGLDYVPPVSIDRTTIPGHDAEPVVNRFGSLSGESYVQLSWPRVRHPATGEQSSEFDSGRAPVSAHLGMFEDGPPLPTGQLVQRVWEAMELPGRGTDYHFALQQVTSHLKSRTRVEPEVMATVETLAWLNVRLVLAYPGAVESAVQDERMTYYNVLAFDVLIDIYSTEGFLNEAVEVARLAERLNQGEQQLMALGERLAMIRGEDVS